ncbi:MAG: 2OG-Fe(II) oxygenase [Nitrincola lacisaponensis]|uniref:2OG-Fe(II) oxygenase n=1 Tax=Nitrincola lacisaponensis TaxID=267850 RepID=UPI00391BDC19
MWELINDIDVEKFKEKVQNAKPFPHFCIDNFLKEDFAEKVYSSFPEYHESVKIGREFKAVNEKKKIQVTDYELFPPEIKQLSDLLASDDFLKMLSYVTGIDDLVADMDLIGGGIHQTDRGGHLDVHIDFNYVKTKDLHRRLNLLLYFNKDWKEEYGGYLDLWDKDVKVRHGYFAPVFNRLCGFVTSDISYHGVTPIKCPPGVVRQSFATYYYTKEAPEGWTGEKHSTIFKPRPDEYIKGYIEMPFEKIKRKAVSKVREIKRLLR